MIVWTEIIKLKPPLINLSASTNNAYKQVSSSKNIIPNVKPQHMFCSWLMDDPNYLTMTVWKPLN